MNASHVMIGIGQKRRRGVGGLAPPPIEREEKRRLDLSRGVTFVLEGAQLETARLGTHFRLLSADENKTYLSRHDKDVSSYRPDILQQSLLTILDSPLCQMGHVRAIYVHTCSNVLIRVDPTTKLPRTYQRFAGLISQLLQKFSIRAEQGGGKLLKCVKGPITNHLPSDAQVIALSREGKVKQRAKEMAEGLEEGRETVFIVGAFAHGHLNVDYAQKTVSITDLPLSAACCLSKLTNALEDKWNIA